MLQGPFGTLVLRCLHCDGDAHLTDAAAACPHCGASYPARAGSIDFMGPYGTASEPDDATIARQSEAIRTALELPPALGDQVRSAVAASRERTGVAYVDAEIAALPTRFGMEIAVDQGKPAASREDQGVFSFLSHQCPTTAAADITIWRTVRVRANRRIAGRMRERPQFGFRFRSSPGLVGKLLAPRFQASGHIPVDIEAGREISVALPIRTPARPGRYLLDIRGGGQLLTTIPISIGGTEAGGVATGPEIGDYGTDHQHALDVLGTYVGDRFGRSSLMLEVASGVHPHLLRFAVAGHRVIATDNCSNMMQLGALSARHHMPQVKETLGFASADAFDLPFRQGQFDVVALFAALHHFPDPVAFLERLRPLVGEGGVIAVMCEPCDPKTAIASDGYVRDLAAGINEQVFSVEEYRLIFERAGLIERVIRNDGGSLKAILAPAGA